MVKIEWERRIAIEILDEFEALLARKGIKIPSEDREEFSDDIKISEQECLFGREYCELEDEITDILKREFPQKK